MNQMNPARPSGLLRTLAAAFVMAILAMTTAHAAPPSDQAAKTFVKGVADQAFAILNDATITPDQQENNLRELMRQEVALDYIGKLALGRFNRPPADATPQELAHFKEQLAEYRRLFPNFAFQKMYNLVLQDLHHSGITVLGTTPVRDTDVIVSTKISRQGKEPINADWRVRTDTNGKLKIIDVVAEGISLTITQRDDFASIIASGGMGKLLESMTALIDSHGDASAATPVSTSSKGKNSSQ